MGTLSIHSQPLGSALDRSHTGGDDGQHGPQARRVGARCPEHFACVHLSATCL